MVAVSTMTIVLTGCDHVKKTVGVSRPESNPHLVISESPLIVPPDIHLRALPEPKPGAPRPQNRPASETARDVLLGPKADTLTSPSPSSLDVTPAGPAASRLVKQARINAQSSEKQEPSSSQP